MDIESVRQPPTTEDNMAETAVHSDLRVSPQRKPFHSRQVARLLAIALFRAQMLTEDVSPEDILAPDHAPVLTFTTPDGRIFTVVVSEVK